MSIKVCQACRLTFHGEDWARLCRSCWELKTQGIDPYRNALDSIATAFIHQANMKHGRSWKKRRKR